LILDFYGYEAAPKDKLVFAQISRSLDFRFSADKQQQQQKSLSRGLIG
jgi:hypothetical protein